MLQILAFSKEFSLLYAVFDGNSGCTFRTLQLSLTAKLQTTVNG